MGIAVTLAALVLPGIVGAQDEIPGPPSTELADPEEHSDAAFGTDVSVTGAVGALLGEWTVPGAHTSVGLRFDAFAVGVSAAGPRLGLSIFGERSLGLLPRAEEDQSEQVVEFPFQYTHFGALCVLRSEPTLPWGGTAGLGFSRIDLDPYYGGAYPLPVMLFEGGVRRHLGAAPSKAFLDMGLRAGWAQLRNPSEALEDLWTVQLSLGLGAHVR